MPVGAVPELRIRSLNDAPVNEGGVRVLYWMTAFRRTRSNFALERAVDWAHELDKPLMVLEPLRAGYRWASDRLHRFVIEGMADNAAAFEGLPVRYHPYVEPSPGEGRGLLAALAKDACVVVTDDWPYFFFPHMQAAAAKQLPVRLEAVDSNGLLPLNATPRTFPTAHVFRLFLARELPAHIEQRPLAEPLKRAAKLREASLPKAVTQRWPSASKALFDGALSDLPIDHAVPPSTMRGGSKAAGERLRLFVGKKLAGYAEARGDPALDGTSRLSPWLHFGHLSVHEILAALERRDGLKAMRDRNLKRKKGSLFGLSPESEGFLDELVVWRELGFNLCAKLPEAGAFESLPPWAQKTLNDHRRDRRNVVAFEKLEAGESGDALFDAAMRQLREEGWFHNQLRMLWGKKLLELTASPEDALSAMRELMNRWSLDGRDPNSVSGSTWVLGRFDRPWGPERPIFGKVRFMTTTSPEKRRRFARYLERWGRAR